MHVFIKFLVGKVIPLSLSHVHEIFLANYDNLLDTYYIFTNLFEFVSVRISLLLFSKEIHNSPFLLMFAYFI